MNSGIDILFLFAYLSMASLPRVFFRREGREFNLRWWGTAAPFMVAPSLVVLDRLGIVPTLLDARSSLGQWLVLASVPLAAASIALMFATMATHRIPLALWHQLDDAPREIVTWGPYARVRHPFYASFLLLMLGTTLLSVQIGTLVCLTASVVILGLTARREEKRLLASRFGAAYAAYLRRTGRFFPGLRTAQP